MKKIICGMLVVVMLCTVTVFSVSADDDQIKVVIDGQSQSYDQPPVLLNDRTLVPLRGIFEALGATVSWDDAEQKVTAVKGSTIIVLKIGDANAYINSNVIKLDQPAILMNSRTLVPVRFVSEAMGAEVSWDGATNTVNIKKGGAPAVTAKPSATPAPTSTTSVKTGPELLNLPDFEDDVLLTGDWIGYSRSEIESTTAEKHGGKMSLKCFNRKFFYHGIGQDVTDLLTENGTGDYQIEGWAKTGLSPLKMVVKVAINTVDGKNFSVNIPFNPNNTEWTKFSGIRTITWEGEIKKAMFYVETLGDKIENATQDYYLDDCSLKMVIK